jgi:cation transporter-like permease
LPGFGVEMFPISQNVAVLFGSRFSTALHELGEISTSYRKEYYFLNGQLLNK